ncbi:MAG: hypothetical protein ACR2NB_06720 [Solirubrobacteraceae bacterium]
MRRLAGILCVAAGLSGCGNARTRPPDIRHPDAPLGTRPYDYKQAGVAFTAPANWQELAPAAALVGGVRNKTATVAVWRYPRSEPLPSGRADLEKVRGLLVGRVKLRDPAFVVRTSRIRRRGGARGIELVGRQTIAGLPYDVRSEHLFKAGAEVVVDAYAPRAEFRRVDRTVFKPLLRSLKVTAP